MAMTKKPNNDKQKNLPPWLRGTKADKGAKSAKAPAKGTKGGKKPKSSNPFAKGK